MVYAIFTPDGRLLENMPSPFPPTLEQMADYCAERAGFADRDEWIVACQIEQIAYAPLH